MVSLHHYFKWDSAVPSQHRALSSSVPSSTIDSWPTTVIEQLSNWSLLQNRDQHHFQPLARKSIIQASLDQEPRRLCRYGDFSYSFHKQILCHFRMLSKQIIHVFRQGFYLLKLEVDGKNCGNSWKFKYSENRPFAKIFHYA